MDADICAIGSGAAGLALVSEFVGTGLRVLLLESGGLRQSPDIDALNEGEIAGLPNTGLNEGRVRVFGGTTDVWPGGCIPLAEADFRKRQWVPHSGWPMEAEDLAPFYVRAESLFRLPEGIFEDDPWEVLGETGLVLDPSLLGDALIAFSPRPHRFLGKSLRRQIEHSGNVRVLLGATVSVLRANESGSAIEEVEARSLEGRRVMVRARAFVVCAGGFENARLLLISGGIGNDHDQVGRYYQDHPVASIASVDTDHPRRIQELYGMFYRGRLREYAKVVLSPELQAQEQVLNCAASVAWEVGAEAGEEALLRIFRALRALRRPILPKEEIFRVVRDLPNTAGFVARYLRGRQSLTAPKSICLLSMAEQEPNPESRITLSNERDALGMPRVRLDWRLTERDRRTAEVMARAVRDEFTRLGVGEVQVAQWLGSDDWRSHMAGPFHPSGTTRMAEDPSEGVVDADCRVHGVSNLYLGGSSVFPTCGYANPTFTIAALSIRLADHLKFELA